MAKTQCLWNVVIKMNSSIDSTNVLVVNLKPKYWALSWPIQEPEFVCYLCYMKPKKAETALNGS